MIALYLAGAFILGSMFTVLVRRKQRACVHHDRQSGHSWLWSELVDTGMRKLWACRGCGQTWS